MRSCTVMRSIESFTAYVDNVDATPSLLCRNRIPSMCKVWSASIDTLQTSIGRSGLGVVFRIRKQTTFPTQFWQKSFNFSNLYFADWFSDSLTSSSVIRLVTRSNAVLSLPCITFSRSTLMFPVPSEMMLSTFLIQVVASFPDAVGNTTIPPSSSLGLLLFSLTASFRGVFCFDCAAILFHPFLLVVDFIKARLTVLDFVNI